MECFKILQQELLQMQQEIIDKDVNEKENEINCFNPITSRRRGRPHHEGNLLENKEMRCKGCQETGHNLRNCKKLKVIIIICIQI
ncbi:unnamed protein product [Rhizophagus irregularis]|uniref:Uncharacterized protein n=1 Tax=Rhizophagus irregularis TaxID=588596 RepID=A0A915Z6W9_9GLOM|nr:unnamed protein product [Rhizophagus irregularis]CAB5364178.1 unnamed protein product [Rhizophagus irregularis]